MTKKIRRRVISETKQVAIIIDSATQSDLFCPFCGDEKMVSPLLAAKLLKISTREIYRLIETDKIHFVEMSDKQIFICLQSIITEE